MSDCRTFLSFLPRSKKFLLVLFCLMVLFGTAFAPTFAQGKVFTAAELAQYDGVDGRPAYYAYEGKVYDVTGSKFWEQGEHYGLHAGQDLTGKMNSAPHGTEVFAPFAVVGSYQGQTPVATAEPTIVNTTASPAPTPSQPTVKSWYEGRIRILGLSILGWTGIIMGVFFILAFGTCFAMPWAKLPLPWKGSKAGPDPLDASAKHLTWSSVHKHFVWWVVIFGLIHGVLGILQVLGFYL